MIGAVRYFEGVVHLPQAELVAEDVLGQTFMGRAGAATFELQVIEALDAHREQQEIDKEHAANLWQEGGWIFTSRLGTPVRPTEDHRAWKALLRMAKVRDARLHDARHTAATILLELKVPLPAVMELMGWSNAAIAKRYMHTDEELATAIAAEVGGHIWADDDTDDEDDEGDDGPAGSLVPA